jgi:hypothetical protein
LAQVLVVVAAVVAAIEKLKKVKAARPATAESGSLQTYYFTCYFRQRYRGAISKT